MANYICMYNVWLQWDGATCNTPYVAINLLRQAFDGRLISRNVDQSIGK